MPLIIGFAFKDEVESINFPVFKLDESEAYNYGLKRLEQNEELFLTYIPIDKYDQMNSENWDNTFILDERNLNDKFSIWF